jgi:hypothetical protein
MIVCKNCGNNFIKKNNNQKYCSKKCTRRLQYRKDYLKNKQKYINWAKEWDRKNPERSKELKRKNNLKWRIKNRERLNELMRSYYYKHKDRWRARSKAFKNIIILEGTLCQKCNKNKAIERHHKNYSKPLDVQLLCKKCHLDLIILKH